MVLDMFYLFIRFMSFLFRRCVDVVMVMVLSFRFELIFVLRLSLRVVVKVVVFVVVLFFGVMGGWLGFFSGFWKFENVWSLVFVFFFNNEELRLSCANVVGVGVFFLLALAVIIVNVIVVGGDAKVVVYLGDIMESVVWLMIMNEVKISFKYKWMF